MRWVGHVTSMARREVYTGFWWGNLRERNHLEEQGKDNTKMDLQDMGWGMNWIDLTQDRDG
jgi:hypothetical protein